MRVIAKYTRRAPDLPLLNLYIHGAPHRRQHVAIIQRYRDELYKAGVAAGIPMPIGHHIALSVLFIDPCSPDFDNLFVALCRAMDGTSHAKPTILRDDSLIEVVEKLHRFYPNPVT